MVFTELSRALASGEEVILATIIGTSGSTPVPAGSAMVFTSGIPVGTVGGGCVEADVIRAAGELRSSGKRSAVLRFTLDEDDIESGMMCGGTVQILVERLERSDRELFERVRFRSESGESSVLLTRLDRHGTVASREMLEDRSSGGPDLAGSIEEAVHSGTLLTIATDDGTLVIEPVSGVQDLFLFGGGHVSKFVSRSAAMAGFRITVVDDRPEYANPKRFPEAWRTLAVPFDHAWEQLEVRPTASIVIVTRGHKFDERVLERAVATSARYIGMIGSAKKVAATFRHLRERGISGEKLRHVRAPIGLAIGARSAEEIGISIVSELIAVRRGILGAASPMSTSHP
jgi:xanthine dehydrogenase accessory factor